MRRLPFAPVVCAVALFGGSVLAGLAAPAQAEAPSGDQLYPNLGNTSLDVQHYDVELNFDPNTDRLSGRIEVSVTALTALNEIVLDSDGPNVTAVTVDKVPVDYEVVEGKLRAALASPLPAGAATTVAITYTRETAVDQPVPGMGPSSVGWFNTPTGSYVLNEPDGMRKWAVVNDHPSDKASWTFTITVPRGTTAVANGLLQARRVSGTDETFVWEQPAPMSTYLVQVLTGRYTLVEWPTTSGPKLSSAAVAGSEQLLEQCRQPLIDQLAFFTGLFGPFPFESYGIAITDSFGGLAMEQQTRSMFSQLDLQPCDGRGAQMYTSHELAHQWFGDSVSPGAWIDIWLNESFATYGQWLWYDHIGQDTLADEAEHGLAARAKHPTASPRVEQMFGINSYDGGAAVLHALRLTIGDEAFLALLKRWAQDNRGTSKRTADFIALAEQVAGRDLTDFFDTWLFAAEVPADFPAPGPASTPTVPASAPG